MVEEGDSIAPTARSEPWNDVMVGSGVGVSGSGCHSVDLGSLLAVLWDMASDMRHWDRNTVGRFSTHNVKCVLDHSE